MRVKNKSGFVYHSMNYHRKKSLCTLLFIVLVFSLYFSAFGPYITNVLTGSVSLDSEKFADDAAFVMSSDGAMSQENVSPVIRNYSLKTMSYWQGDKYEFDVKLGEAQKTPVRYTTKNTDDSFVDGESKEYESAILYRADINGVITYILAYPHQELAAGSTVTGIFTEIPPIISNDIATLGETSFYCKYMLDTRGIEMESERFDVMISAVLLALIIYLFVRLVVFYVNPYLTPTYRSLDKYGDVDSVIVDIEAELAEAGVKKISKKNPVYTTNWILSEDSFKLKILRNHAKPQDNSRYGSKL